MIMEPTLRQLEYLVAVADTGTFIAAAQRMNVSQPALSSQIAEAEQRLGVTVFERSRSGATITPEGEALIEAARRVLDANRELMRLAAERDGDIVGELTIGVIPTIAPYLLPAIVREVRRRYPSAELYLRELQTIPLVESIKRGEVDFGILAAPVPQLDGSLDVSELGVDPFVLALPEGADPSIDRDQIHDLTDLADLPILLLEDGHCLREHAASACSVLGVDNFGSVQASGLSSLCQMVAAGMGATLLPRSAIEVEARPGSGLALQEIGDPAPFRTIVMAWRPGAARREHYRVLACAFEPVVDAVGG